jgi:HPt (histidine-containing phosphotransfer) domain-containing protein
MEQADLSALKEVIHQLKGSGGTYGFPGITRSAAEAERRIMEHEPLAKVREGVEELVRMVRSVEGYDSARERPLFPSPEPGRRHL